MEEAQAAKHSDSIDHLSVDIQENITIEAKKLNDFIMKYQMDIETLNRILSTYEDKITVLESQYHDLSYRFKQFQANSEQK